jgi:hypothetical protein
MKSKSIYKPAFWTLFIICNVILVNLSISFDYYHIEFSAIYLLDVLIYWLLISSGISSLLILINLVLFIIRKRTLLLSSFFNIFPIITGIYGGLIWLTTRIFNLPMTGLFWRLALLCTGLGLLLFILLFVLNRKKKIPGWRASPDA